MLYGGVAVDALLQDQDAHTFWTAQVSKLRWRLYILKGDDVVLFYQAIMIFPDQVVDAVATDL